MRNFKPRWRSIVQAMAFSTAAFLVCGTELAQGTTPVNGFVVINPISVCDSGTGLCAPFGVSCTSASGSQVCTQFATPSKATTTTPIGFVDADTNVNLTRAFWAQAGIDVVFFPVQSYSSPTNAIDSSWNNIKDGVTNNTFTYSPTNYQTLHQVNVTCADNINVLTSPDFQTLTQHSICSDHGGLPNGSKLANPPLAASPVPPTVINGCSQALPCLNTSNAIDTFFVNSYVAPPGTSNVGIFGFSWINGDGVSVNKSIFTTVGPRFDTLAHEIGHALALDHNIYGAGSSASDTKGLNDMLTSGSSRDTSQKSGCQVTMSASGTPSVSNGGALYDLDYTTASFNPCMNYNMTASFSADQLTTGSACTNPKDLTTCTNQEAAAAISPFINQTAPNTANAGGGQAFLANAATTNTPSSGGSGSPAPLQITITADGNPNDSNVPDLAATIIALPPSDPLSFNGNQPVAQIGGTPINPNVTCDANHLKNCAVTVTNVVKLSNQQVTGNPGCDSGSGQPPSSQCVRITYSVAPTNGFGPDNPACQVPPSPPGGCVFPPPASSPGIFVILAVSFNKAANDIITGNLLTGAQYTSIDANGFATTSLFEPAPGGFIANSANPDLTTANVLLNPSKFQNVNALDPPKGLGLKLSRCTPPYATVFVKVKGQLVPETVCPDGNLPGNASCPIDPITHQVIPCND